MKTIHHVFEIAAPPGKIFAALTRNPKTPVALTLNILSRLNAKDMSTLAVDRNVPEAVRIAARKKIVANRD